MDAQVTGNIGMYYACYRLSCLGWNVMPTARNARGIDIVAYTRNGVSFVGIQVKSLSKRDPVPLGSNLDNIIGDYWIIVFNVAKEPSTVVMTPNEVKALAHRSGREGNVSYWLEPKDYDNPEFKEAWHRIEA